MNMSREEFLNNVNWAYSITLGISDEKQDIMMSVYSEIWSITNRPEMFAKTGADAVVQIRSLEYLLQTLWGFERDARFHRYCFEIKGCTCPRMDNRDAHGTDLVFHNNDCPFHGNNRYEEL